MRWTGVPSPTPSPTAPSTPSPAITTPRTRTPSACPSRSPPPAASGLETLLAVSLDLYHQGRLSLLEVVDKLTRTPADILRLPLGRLAPGRSADLVLFDPEKPWRIDVAALTGKSRNSPFDGRLTSGRILRTVVDGRTVFTGAAAAA